MKRIFKIALCFIMTAVVLCSVTACKTDNENSGKTAINLSYFIGEFGDEWIKNLAEEWSASNDKYYVDVKTNLNLSSTITADIKSGSKYDIFITEDCSFVTLFSGDYLEDLSDVFSSKPENNKTVAEKLSDSETWMALAKRGDAIYMLPYNISPCGLIFDYDRFAEKGWLVTDSDGNISAGKDGIVGTYDDGQPATMEEFKSMCEKIKASGVDNVFLYMGANHPEYVDNVAYSYFASVVGEEGYKTFYTHDSNGNEIELVDGTKTVVAIEDGYKTWQMKGIDDMAEFLQDYLCNSRYVTDEVLYDKSLSVDSTHTKFIEIKDNAPAFIVEGNWFENGAKSLIQSNVKYGGKEYGTSDYRYMLLPSADGEKSQVFSQTGGSMIVTKQKDSGKLAAIKDFLTFILKDENLGQVTADTGMIWNYSYSLTDAQKQAMTKFTSNTYNMVNDTENISMHAPYIEMASTPIYAYSQLASGGLMWCDQSTFYLAAGFRNAGNASTLVSNIISYNSATRWESYLKSAKSYGYYVD